MRIDVLRRSLFKTNDKAAAENRRILDEYGVTAVNIMGGAGCGKTTLLEKVIPRLRDELAIGVLEGDIATARDAERIAALNVPVVQLLTEGGCHLTATLVQQGLARLELPELDLVMIENVGNPICPVHFDLGEHARLAVLSVAEGDDKPAKYPYMYKSAHSVIISKCDLIQYCQFNIDRTTADIRVLNPGVSIHATNLYDATTISPLARWIRSIHSRGCTADALSGLAPQGSPAASTTATYEHAARRSRAAESATLVGGQVPNAIRTVPHQARRTSNSSAR